MPLGRAPDDLGTSGRDEPNDRRRDETEKWGQEQLEDWLGADEVGPDEFDARDVDEFEGWDVDEFDDGDVHEFEGADSHDLGREESGEPGAWLVREGKHLAVALRSGRRRLGWNQRELAKRAGLSQPTVARLEAGADARFSVVLRALRACGLQLFAAPPAGAPTDWGVVPHPMDEGRDSAGRRLPAHLPAYATEYVPTYTLWKRMVRGESLFAERPPHWLYAREPWPVPPPPPNSRPNPSSRPDPEPDPESDPEPDPEPRDPDGTD